jgi:hypothetical protein
VPEEGWLKVSACRLQVSKQRRVLLEVGAKLPAKASVPAPNGTLALAGSHALCIHI